MEVSSEGKAVENGGFVGSGGAHENFLIDDLDAYLDDLSARLIVSRMVNDSIVKGMVNAVIHEASEEVSSKDLEIEMLKERLLLSEAKKSSSDLQVEQLGRSISVRDMGLVSRKQLQMLKSDIKHLQHMSMGDAKPCGGDVFGGGSVVEILSRVCSGVDMLDSTLEALHEESGEECCPQKEFLCEQQWKRDLERRVESTVVGHFIKWKEFHVRKCEEHFCQKQRRYWMKKSKELSDLRDELYAVSTSALAGPELDSLNIFEERKSANNTRNNPSRKVLARHLSPCSSKPHENGGVCSGEAKEHTVEVDMAHLTHLSKEEYILKQELTKEELITYYVTEMAKMSRKHESALQEKTEELFKLKREILKTKGSSPLRKDKEFEILRKKIPELISRLDNIIEVDDGDQLLTVKEDNNLLYNLKDQVSAMRAENQCLKDLIAEERREVKCLFSKIRDAMTQVSRDTSTDHKFLEQATILRQSLEDAKIEDALQDEVIGITFGHFINSLQSELVVSQTHLIVLEEFVKHAVSISHTTMQRCKKEELNSLEKQKEELELLLLLNEHQIDNLKGRLNDAGTQVCQYGKEMQQISQKLKDAEYDLKESEKKRVILENVIHEEKVKASSAAAERDLVTNKIKALAIQTVGVSKSLDEFENKILQKVQRNESRLEKLKNFCNPAIHTVHSLLKEVSRYKCNIEIKLSNLQKAEDEVDLLGDEVEALLSVLAKVYITLDHYSLVLQHYPGVMEILKLVRTELEGSVKPSHRYTKSYDGQLDGI